jgi:hypothetical protein
MGFKDMKELRRRARFISIFALVLFLAACDGGSEADGVASKPVERNVTNDDAVGLETGYSSLVHQGYSLLWRVNGDMLDFVLSYETTGWISVGFDPSRMMQDANIIIGYVADGTATISDQYGTGRTTHRPDTEIGGADSLVNAAGVEEKGYTEMSFSIPLDSGEDSDRPLKPGGTYTVLLGHGPDGADDFTTYHAGRTSVEIEL